MCKEDQQGTLALPHQEKAGKSLQQVQGYRQAGSTSCQEFFGRLRHSEHTVYVCAVCLAC